MKENRMMTNQDKDPQIAPDNFELFLREQLQQHQHYVEDGDFSARVMSSLPAPRRLSRLQERLILLVPLIVISLLVLSQFSLTSGLKTWYLLLSLDFTSLLKLGVILAISAVSAASYWMAKQFRLI